MSLHGRICLDLSVWCWDLGRIVGAVLLLMPPTVVRGAWLLLAVFVMAILLHLLHGLYGVGHLVVYAAAAFAIAVSKG